MQDTSTLTEQDIRVRCLGIAINLEQMKHQQEVQKWAHDGRSGYPPELPATIDYFDKANELLEFVSNDDE